MLHQRQIWKEISRSLFLIKQSMLGIPDSVIENNINGEPHIYKISKISSPSVNPLGSAWQKAVQEGE